jgi:predicted HTH domain antitoxin
MGRFTIEIPDDLLAKFENGGGDAGKELRLAAAFSLCSRGELSTSQAARLAGLAYADFLDAAARAKVEVFPINYEELEEESRVGYTLGRQRVARDPAGPSR